MLKVVKNFSAFQATVQRLGIPYASLARTRQTGLYLSAPRMAKFLNEALVGKSLGNLSLRTRSKVAKTMVLTALGYTAPDSFKQLPEDLPAQNADIYVQRSNNLQVWNAKLEPKRRYILILLNESDEVRAVRVVSGRKLATWNKTGTLTTKFQATLKLVFGDNTHVHVCGQDTERTRQFLSGFRSTGVRQSSPLARGAYHPKQEPSEGQVLAIQELGERLADLVGKTIPYVSAVDDKKRSAGLLDLVNKALGYATTGEAAGFPDVPHQMLEVKLQMSPTIDLGRTWPVSDSPLNFSEGRSRMLRRRDVRFAVFYGTKQKDRVRIDRIVITPGARFWDVFQTLQGLKRNTKLQIKLPDSILA